MINYDEIHLVTFKKKHQLRIKRQIGSFICNNKAAGEEAKNILKEMNFSLRFPWHYDPFGIIAETRLKNNISPYAHMTNPEIEKFMSQTDWKEDTLLEIEEQHSPSNISHTNTPQVKIEKRDRKEVSLSVTKVSYEDFQVYRKRTRTSHTPESLREE
jgi:hypothetical protein